jgi:hypothetical protein
VISSLLTFPQYPICIPFLPIRVISHPAWLDRIMIFDDEYKLLSSSLCNFLTVHPSSFQIFSSAPCSQTPSVFIPALVSDQISHSYRTTGKIIHFCNHL